ncbi:hypothetical protein [Sphaerimonospora thailandensis]|uniref:Uncharacterized protein n=1 Tax=Sphaerimonospora thailandensis TaxID=795644 RepID=A0A8J3RD44_9ACTN|nr:hypothetical protein [Sphaerimonospora thailandensis]GIH70318.1 hypothetical protein Mth01_25710 [Sphaerimonospora thailandensis]
MADHDIAETRRLVREFLAGQRILAEQGRIRWPFELLKPHKRHLGSYFARVHLLLIPGEQTGDVTRRSRS